MINITNVLGFRSRTFVLSNVVKCCKMVELTAKNYSTSMENYASLKMSKNAYHSQFINVYIYNISNLLNAYLTF